MILLANITGGLKDIVEKEFSPLNIYCEWLENYRKQLFYAYRGKIDTEKLKEVLTPLLYFYRKILVESKNENIKTLETDLLKPLEKFFIEIDKDYTGEYFSKELEEIQKNLIELKIVLMDRRERPITNTSIIFRNTENQEELSEKSIYFSFSTDREGRVRFFIPKGEYIMKIPKYKHSEKIKVEKNAEILRLLKRKSPIFSIFKSSLPQESQEYTFEYIINKTRFLLSMFLPFLIGLSITYLLVKLGIIQSPIPSADIGLSAIITFYLPSSYIAVFLLWFIGGMIGIALYNRIIISMISMLLLSWTCFLLTLNEISFSYIEYIANSHWLPSLPIILIINTIIMILAFMIGAATIIMIGKRLE